MQNEIKQTNYRLAQFTGGLLRVSRRTSRCEITFKKGADLVNRGWFGRHIEGHTCFVIEIAAGGSMLRLLETIEISLRLRLNRTIADLVEIGDKIAHNRCRVFVICNLVAVLRDVWFWSTVCVILGIHLRPLKMDERVLDWVMRAMRR